MRKAKDKLVHRGQIIQRQSFLFIFIVPLVLLLSLLLAACGSNGGIGTGAGSTPTSAPTRVTVNGSPEGCPSKAVTNPPATKPDVIIKIANSNSTVSVHKGDLIEVRLPFNERWIGPAATRNILELQTPAGYPSQSNKACVWHFKAGSTGTTTLTFSGRAICKPGQICPMYVINVPFTVDVK